MKNLLLSVSLSFGLLATASATITWDIQMGSFLDESGTQVPENSLWAIIYQDSSGNLPGGLASNGSLTNLNVDAISSAFSGATISPGAVIDGSTILYTGIMDASGIATYSMAGASYPPFTGVSPGGSWGLYWFPELTPTANEILGLNFEVGGFSQVDFSVEPYGTIGTVIPGDAAVATTIFFDRDTTGVPTDLPATRFTAVVVPEPGTMALSILALVTLLRRRRH